MGESKFGKFVFSGTGPGLFFMAFGAIVLVVMIVWGRVSVTETKTKTTGTESGTPTPKSEIAEPTLDMKKGGKIFEQDKHEIKKEAYNPKRKEG